MATTATAWLLFMLFMGCQGTSSPPPGAPSPMTTTRNEASAADAPEAASTAFVRVRPEHYAVRSVDACAYLGGAGFACIDALTQEPDAVRVKYMRRLSDAYARLDRDQDYGSPAHAEAADCCNVEGPCGSEVKKTGHTDCAKMDEGYACLTAAELHVSAAKSNAAAAGPEKLSQQKMIKIFHERACKCDPVRAQIPVMGGLLACDGPNKPVKRGYGTMEEQEAREATQCAVCDPITGPSSCAAEIKRLRASNASDIAAYIERVHITRCQLP